MASKDYTQPYQDLTKLVPKNLQNPMLVSLVDNLFNRFMTKDESIPLYGYVGRKPTSTDDQSPRIPQASVERDINALTPVFNFRVGTETFSFTPQDLIRKAVVLGVPEDQSKWLFSQGNNYAPPIDLERFTNFFNYFWVANALVNPPSMPWNPTNAPEYYTIAQPKITDLDKLNVKAATSPVDGARVLTGSGFDPQTWTVTFTSPTNFTVSCMLLPGILPTEQNQSFTLPTPTDASVSFPGPWDTDTFPVTFVASNSPTGVLLRFDIVRDMVLDGDGLPLGYESFQAGDQFTITAPFISSTYSVSFTGSSGIKGKIVNVNSLDVYQTIDGVQVADGDRVLIRNQGTAAQNGIYVVKPGAWLRAADFSGITEVPGARVFVTDGTVNAKALFTSAGPSWVWNVTAQPTVSNTNEWQEHNYWLSAADLATSGIDTSKVVQATRPIIEFNSTLPLNSRFDSAGPIDIGGTRYEQIKTEFNQAPLFDLYRYDGTHARLASPIFFYVEDPTAEIDVALQRRVKRAANQSGDFLFAHGLIEKDSLLFYKDSAGALHTVWHPGYNTATIVDQSYTGTGNGTLSVSIGADPFTAQQIWTLTAISPTTFEVNGSKLAELPSPHNVMTVGAPYSNGIFNATITAGSTPFAQGDVFTFRIGNFETTRYVERVNDQLFDMFGGASADVNSVGAWQVPRMFYNNVASDSNSEIPEGTLYSHFRGILSNQLHGGQENRAFGGSIKLWSEQQNLLASLLMQRDLTPISMIDLAQREYETGINAIIDIYFTNLVKYLGDKEAVITTIDVEEFVDYILAIRALDNDVRTVLYDTTSGVTGFPITLPQLAVTPAHVPTKYFDEELGDTLLRHHDGHSSPLFVYNQEFRDRLVSPELLVQRSDGALTPAVGSYTTSPPVSPYKGEIWLYPYSDRDEFRVFNVLGDQAIAPAQPVIGDYWYNRQTGVLSIWNGVLWAPEPNQLAPWTAMDPAELLNDVLLTVENRLFQNVNSDHRTYFTEIDVLSGSSGYFADQLERELATWAAANGYDPMAPDYVSTDAFTWNYSSLNLANVAPVSTTTVPARWFNLLTAHHETFGPAVIPTARPNLEPWKLLGNTTKPVAWDATYAASITPDDVDAGGFLIGSPARAVIYSTSPIITPLTGLPTVDGVTMNAGDTVLLVSEIAPQSNGLWIVGSGAWTRASQPLTLNTIIPVLEGATRSGTNWAITTAPVLINTDPVVFEQVRLWKQQMWLDILAARPALKLSVDINRDFLLAPYVNASLPWSVHALTTIMPPTPELPYSFGQSSPVETVWTKSVGYRYSMARALFRQTPLEFLGSCWGFEWVEVDGILYDGFDVSMPGHPRFRLHGEPISSITRSGPIQLVSISGPTAIDVSIAHDGYTSTHQQSWTIRAGDTLIGYVNEGVLYPTITANGYIITNLRIEDQGRPFRVGDKFRVLANADGSGMTVQFLPAAYHQILGFGQIFTNALRAAAIDTNQGYSIQAYRGWNANLGYRAGGLISTDDLRISTDANMLPESAYTLQFKRSAYAKDLWLQGLRITVVQIGQSVPAPSAGYVPSTAASDWVFRVEGYNSRYLGIEYYTLDTADEYVTFKALNGAHTNREWKHYSKVTGTVSAELPLIITGLQNVLNFLFGYSALLQDNGWVFDDPNASNIDATTGRVRNWQLEIEKFVDAVYSGIDLGQGISMNPFIDRVWLRQDHGLLAEYVDAALFDITAYPGVFDALGVRIPTSDLLVLRGRSESQIGAQVPMFTVHAQIDEFEHLVVFNNYASPSTSEGLIYDPFSGARIATVKINGRRQASQTLRPEFGGHYLVGNEVKRNLQSSTDKVAQYYDTDHVFEDELSTRHALALLGFSPKEYMSNLDLTDRSQFNFWRGLIQMKGTNASINAFLNNDRFEDAKLDEYWAYKVAEYGDSRSKVFPELKLSVTDTLQQFTKLQFNAITALPTFTQISATDEDRWFSIEDLNQEPHFLAKVVGTFSKTATPGEIIDLDFVADKLVIVGDASQLNASTIIVGGTGGLVTVTGYGSAAPKFNPVKLFNYVDAELVEEIPLWHPAFGQHTPAALSSINVISDLDPARYNVSTLVSGNANYDPLRMWGAREVGRVWWDTTNLEYVPYADYMIYGALDERLNRWGALADFATVDVVEWVESSVPPSDYAAQGSIDAGNADADQYTRADGTVHGSKTYSRDRIWSTRPIAWSKAGVALAASHPSFNASYVSNIKFTNDGLAVLETNTFADYGISAGMRIGAWQEDSIGTRPLSEYVIQDDFTKQINGAPTSIAHGSGFDGEITVSVLAHTDKVGQLAFSQYVVGAPALYDDTPVAVAWDVTSSLRVIEVNSGEEDVVQVRVDRGIVNTGPYYGATFTVTTGQNFVFDFESFGLRITLVSTVSGTFTTQAMVEFLSANLGTFISLNDAVRVLIVSPLSDPDNLVTDVSEFSNDPIDPQYAVNNGVGWRAWSVPTQADLDADSRTPNGSWYPYVGEFIPTSSSIDLIQDASSVSTLVLNDGTEIPRYSTDWTDWAELKQVTLRSTATVTGSLTFTIQTGVTSDRISVYVNGVAQLVGTYTLVGNVLTIPNVQQGHLATVIIRAYSPTPTELAFDPAVADNLLVQRQYKLDYQYVQVPIRASDGAITSTKYYFWVKNRSIAARKKALSVKAIAQLLSEGPSQYLTFQHIIGDGSTGNEYRYDAVAIAGLNYVVTKDNTFKLRFTRNFTLRDDPNELDLKDTHTEWALIRPGQRTKIPEKLWQKMTDTACEQDVAGNTLPSPGRSSYDVRNGTQTRFGFGPDQVLAPPQLVKSTLLYTILNTVLVDDSGTIPVPDYIAFLDYDQSHLWFSTPQNTRNTLTRIWNEAKVSQINELFFAVLNDICASNYQLTDVFKTSRLSAYSIKVVSSTPAVPTYE